MAMQSATAVAPEKIPVQWYGHQQPSPHYQMDERDGFLMWLMSEFAAANAMIDALCHHLRAVGEPGEYDGVVGCIQQRRCNWNPILHMQQYFSVAEVVYALQQVSLRQQQQRAMGFEGAARAGRGGKEFRRGGRGQRGGVEVQNFGRGVNGKDLNSAYVKSDLNVNEKLDEGKAEVKEKEETKDGWKTKHGKPQTAVTHAEEKTYVAESCNMDVSGLKLQEKQNHEVTSKTFVATEICDGKAVNVAEGMKLYEDLFNESEVSKILISVNDLRAAGKGGELQGQTFVISKRPMKGHGREMIQLGVPIADAPPEVEAAPGTFKEQKAEPIPASMQGVIERLLTEQVVSIKPDSCVIDIFNEGDHSQPHIWPHWFGRPVCVLFLTECEMSFGKVFTVDHPGDYRGALKLSLSPGSMLVMQGKSTDFTQHAIPSLTKQRILITFTKSQAKKITPTDIHRSSNRAPPPSRSPNHIHPMAAKHFSPVPPPGVLHPPPNGIQPMFVTTPITPGLVAVPPVSVGWTHHPPPRLPVPGTGVFLPSQSSTNSPNLTTSPMATETITTETSAKSEDGLGKSNGTEIPDKECNGGINGMTDTPKKEGRENVK